MTSELLAGLAIDGDWVTIRYDPEDDYILLTWLGKPVKIYRRGTMLMAEANYTETDIALLFVPRKESEA